MNGDVKLCSNGSKLFKRKSYIIAKKYQWLALQGVGGGVHRGLATATVACLVAHPLASPQVWMQVAFGSPAHQGAVRLSWVHY